MNIFGGGGGPLSNFDNNLRESLPTNDYVGSDSDLGRFMGVMDPMGIPFQGIASGELGLFGTPTTKGAEGSLGGNFITDIAHRYGAEIAAIIAGGLYFGGGSSFGAGEGVGAGDAGMGGGYTGEAWNAGEVGGAGTEGGTGGMDLYESGLDYPNSGSVAGDVNAGGSEFSNYAGSSNAMDAEPGGNWSTNGARSSLTNSGTPSGTSGTPGTWESWAKAMGPAAVMGGLQMYGNYRKNASAEERNKKAQEDFERNKQQQDSPPPNPWLAKIGPMTPQQYSDNPLATYGQRPETTYFKRARGGLALAEGEEGMDGMMPPGGGLEQMGSMVEGEGGGQEDNVPAMLSPKEYIFDADVVAALGDGNPDEGSRRLDEMRKKIRAHKRSAPVGKIPPKARMPEQYLRAA